MRRTNLTRGVVFVLAVSLCTVSYGAMIENIQGTLASTVELYYGAGDYFQLNASGGGGPAPISVIGISTAGQPVPDYWMYDGTVGLTPSALVSDDSAGGMALGTFASGATLTINGNLYRDFGDYGIAATGDLVIANIMFDWELEEQLSPPYPSNTLLGQVHFDIVGGALSDAGLNDDGLVLGDFYLDLTFERCQPTVTDFTTNLGDQMYSTSTAKLQGGAIPEPTTLLLLGLGSLAAWHRRK